MKKAGKKYIIVGAVVLLLVIGAITSETSKKPEQAAEPTATVELTATPTSAPTEAPTPEPTAIPTLKQGMKDDNVAAMQTRLIELGYLSGEADGDFGKGTLQAVKDFQICNGLTEDGEAGEETLTKLYRYNAVRQRTVYVSSTGTYHIKSDCSGMKSSTEMKLSDAIRKGYKGHDCK